MKRKDPYDTNFSYLQTYYQKGGTYILPVEILNDLTTQIEELVAEVKESNDSAEWWRCRYNGLHNEKYSSSGKIKNSRKNSKNNK